MKVGDQTRRVGNLLVVIAEGFVRSVRLPQAVVEQREGYPWRLPAVRALAGLDGGLELHSGVTYLIGENGAGKSTVLEAIAVAAGMNPEGGSSGFAFSTRESHSSLSDEITLIRGVKQPRIDFFLRAESLFTAATYLEQLKQISPDALKAYGGRSLHEQSHGESFLAVMLNRFGPEGFYVLDEPEAALSAQNCLTFLRRVHELVQQGSQFLIATHSPLVLAYPEALIYSFGDAGLENVSYDDAEPVRLTRNFLGGRQRFMAELLRDDETPVASSNTDSGNR